MGYQLLTHQHVCLLQHQGDIEGGDNVPYGCQLPVSMAAEKKKRKLHQKRVEMLKNRTFLRCELLKNTQYIPLYFSEKWT